MKLWQEATPEQRKEQGLERPRRWVDFELCGLWGADARLLVEVKTEKGAAAVSMAVLRWVVHACRPPLLQAPCTCCL
jgi:hypothetical protein